MTTSHHFALSSHLAAPAAEVWGHASSMAGVNRELWPLARMTHPPAVTAIDAADVVLGERAFRSWILLFGVLPVDYDDLTLVELEPGRRFLERSPMLTQALWEHEREIEPAAGGCKLSDRVTFTPRLPLMGRLHLPVFRLAFRLRHRNLRRLFGEVA